MSKFVYILATFKEKILFFEKKTFLDSVFYMYIWAMRLEFQQYMKLVMPEQVGEKIKFVALVVFSQTSFAER